MENVADVCCGNTALSVGYFAVQLKGIGRQLVEICLSPVYFGGAGIIVMIEGGVGDQVGDPFDKMFRQPVTGADPAAEAFGVFAGQRCQDLFDLGVNGGHDLPDCCLGAGAFQLRDQTGGGKVEGVIP